MRLVDPDKSLTDVIMFYGATNVQLDGENLKIYYPKLTIMLIVGHSVSLFFVYVLKTCKPNYDSSEGNI